MNTYLTIMVTVLAITQVIRITQNQINLNRQNKMIKRDVEWLKERDITEDDFEVQREAFQLLRDHLIAEDDFAVQREAFQLLRDHLIAEDDFAVQREAFQLLRDHLKERGNYENYI